MVKAKKLPYVSSKVQVGDVIELPAVSRENHYEGKVGPTDILEAKHSKHPDPKLSGAHCVVERTAMTGGGTGHDLHDVYPDGWEVRARVLNKDGTYNPKGRVVCFYQSGCFNCMIELVRVVRKMRMTFE